MTSWPDARQIAYQAADVLPPETVALGAAAGRTLAADLLSRSALPSFDAAAMDGWAVRGLGPWTVVGTVLAGDAPWAELRDGEAVEIATGAVVPAGAEGVIPHEAGPLAAAPHPAGRHVRRAGEECRAGELVVPGGTVLRPAALGLAAAVGCDVLSVRRKPTVACLVTGSELLVEGVPAGGRIRDAVGPLLEPTLRSMGADVRTVEHLVDDRPSLLAALRAGDTDVVITSGASAHGPADHLAGLLRELDAELLVDGVAVKPGHPQVLARLPDGRLLVGLPGNPLAALVGLVTLVQPLLCGLLGRPLPELGCSVLSETVPGHPSSYRLVPVVIRNGRAAPTRHGGAAMLRGAALAEAFAVLEPGAEGRVGDQVALLALP